jgi:hypothetical protein
VSLIALTWKQMVFNFRGSASGPVFLRPWNVWDIAYKKLYLLHFYSLEAQITIEFLEQICVQLYELLKSVCFSLSLYV